MMLSTDPTVNLARDVHAVFSREKQRVDRLDDYLRGEHDKPYTPRNSAVSQEYKLLQKRSTSNWLPLIIDVMAQALFVEGYRSNDGDDNADAWARLWLPNGLASRQTAVHRAAFAYGTSYVTVVAGDPVPAIRGASPRRMIAVYDDPAEDLWPVYALLVTSGGKRFRFYDSSRVYEIVGDGWPDEIVAEAEHGAPVCPVIRFVDNMDLDGRARGEIEPLIPLQDRINQTAFDLLVAQTWGSFKVRTISGMAVPLGSDGKPIADIELSVKRLLTAPDPDTKFGTLDETPLDGYLSSLDQAVRQLAAISQTPPHYLLGQMANLSAEALVAAESGLTRKTDERKAVFGPSWEQVLELGATIDGIEIGEDARVIWRDSEARSLAQTADALGKIAEMLKVPPQALWEKIPGVTLDEVERWKALARESDAMAMLMDLMDRQARDLETADGRDRAR